MLYCITIAISQGNPSDVYRATDKFGNICGQSGTATELYPYAYLYSPSELLDNRVCVKACPAFVSGTLSTLDCYNFTCTYVVVIDSSGNFNVTPTANTEVVGYETSTTLSRVCLPSTTVF